METPKPRHGEAFMLMNYACRCGHREVIWNSRDGVTPFGLDCPSCGETSLRHVDWKNDQYAPGHKPYRDQRFFRDGTPDEAEAIMRRRIKLCEGGPFECTPEYAAELIKSAREGNSEFQKGWPMVDRQVKETDNG